MSIKFFDNFPKVIYTLDDNESEQILTDIFKRVVLSEEFKKNTSFFEEYNVLDGETPEDVSYRFYGTQQLHWLILMINDIINPRFEWPTTDSNLLEITKEKYGGAEAIFTPARAKEVRGYVVETYYILAEESTHKNPVRIVFETIGDNPTRIPISYQDSPNAANLESNLDVENEKNETNRRIKVIKASVVSDIVEEYMKLINL